MYNLGNTKCRGRTGHKITVRDRKIHPSSRNILREDRNTTPNRILLEGDNQSRRYVTNQTTYTIRKIHT